MIEVSLSTFFAIPVAIHLGILLIIWLADLWSTLAHERRDTASGLYRCTVCEHVYVDRRALPMVRCARCGSMNNLIRR